MPSASSLSCFVQSYARAPQCLYQHNVLTPLAHQLLVSGRVS